MSMPLLTLTRDTLELVLSQPNGWVVLPGVEGLDDPPRALIEVEPATWDGSLPVASRYQTREVFLPLHYMTDTTEALRSVTRGLAQLTDVKRGAVTLEVAHADGTRRWAEGYLSAPFATTLAQAEGSAWRQFGLTLRCGDPFWLGEQQSISFAIGGDIPEFLSDEFLPVQVANSQVVGDINIVNYADADAWPQWTLTGPLDEATIAAGDLVWTIPAPGLSAAETLVVDTGRGVQTVAVDGTAAWGRLGPGAQFGPLQPGSNPVLLTLTGATADTTLTVAWRERWLTAW